MTDVLAPFRGKRVFFDRLRGNNGDRLIEMGSREVIRAASTRFANSPQDADLIVLNGGAGMTTIWKRGFDTLQYYNQQYGDTPLLVLPSSFGFDGFDFASLFRDRRSSATLFARERPSLRTLQAVHFPCPIALALDHDMAFALRDTDYIRQLRESAAARHILIVERGDAEGVTGAPPLTPMGPSIKRFVPTAVKDWVRHAVWNSRARRRQGLTPFAQRALQQALDEHPRLRTLPTYNSDISEPRICGFRRFGHLIARSAFVITTRLHVAILASMLDKPTYLKPGSFHKIAGIYDYSLRGVPGIHLI